MFWNLESRPGVSLRRRRNLVKEWLARKPLSLLSMYKYPPLPSYLLHLHIFLLFCYVPIFVMPSTIPFVSLHCQPGLVSLDAARSSSAIVYRSIDIMYPAPSPRPVTPLAPVPVLKNSIRLVPLATAQASQQIKYRREGFEMQEHRRH
ncbi:hypothetical protein BDY19DRAFT_1045267, partial [Irpex rosettiformis]